MANTKDDFKVAFAVLIKGQARKMYDRRHKKAKTALDELGKTLAGWGTTNECSLFKHHQIVNASSSRPFWSYGRKKYKKAHMKLGKELSAQEKVAKKHPGRAYKGLLRVKGTAGRHRARRRHACQRNERTSRMT
jgi:hypothetical protein